MQDKGPKRLMYIRDEFKKFLDVTPVIDLLTYENYSYGSKNRTLAYTIGELGGVLKLAMFERGLSYLVISPKSAQKFILGGNEMKDVKSQDKKSLTAKEVLKRYKKDFYSLDLIDAYVLAQLGWAMYCLRNKMEIKLHSWQQESIAKIEETIAEKLKKKEKKKRKTKQVSEEEDIL
jgi:Holliday junction resolvasome RuvABC endonuclease subunit